MSRSREILQRARRVMPGGVNSPVRAFKAVGGEPPVIVSARGCTLTDADGRAYIDYVGSWGAAIVGHAHPAVVEAVCRAAADGLSVGLCTEREVELAEAVIARVPSVEKIRMVNSGTEAVMSAVRLARAATSRRKIIKFDGGYHGHADAMLVKPGSGPATLRMADSQGVTRGAIGDTLIASYNAADSVESLLDAHPREIAAILVEPAAGNMGVVPPADGFLAGLRALADHHGVLLIFDEVMTGFRLARGGAQERFGVRADLTTFGKIIGGGLPVGAYGGRADLMDLVAPVGPVYQGGTFCGNPATMAAGLATLDLLDGAAYAQLEWASARLADGLTAALHERGLPSSVQRVGSMLSVFFGVGDPAGVRDMNGARDASTAAFATVFHALLQRGVHLPPSLFESWFVSLAHGDREIDRTLRAFRESLDHAELTTGTGAPTHAVTHLERSL